MSFALCVNRTWGLFIMKYLTIIGQHRAKYCDLTVASRSIICQSQRLRQLKSYKTNSLQFSFRKNVCHLKFPREKSYLVFDTRSCKI